jgi:hypothetical protein
MRRRTEGDPSSSHVLLVEGPDDRHVLDHLLTHHGISGQFELEQSGGADAVLASLRTRLKFKSLQRLGIVPEEERRFPVRHVAKANIHTWLAWQEEPGKPIGQAITKKYLDAGAPHALKLIAWLRALYDLDPH